MPRISLAGAAWGPVIFIACWLIGGQIAPGYSPISEPISELAAVGSKTRPLMNVGLAAFALGVGTAAWPMRSRLGPWAAAAMAVNALMTVGVLATPLDNSPSADTLHAIFAGLAYIWLTAVGLLAARYLRNRAWLVIGLITGAALAIRSSTWRRGCSSGSGSPPPTWP